MKHDVDLIWEAYLQESIPDPITAIFPGGFKPPHKGHFELAKDFINDPSVNLVKILLGPTKRESKDGSIVIGEAESRLIWEQYYLPALPMGKIQLVSTTTPNPMVQAFEYIQETATEGEIIALVSSKKDEKDAARALDFAKKHEKGTGKYYRPGVSVVYHPSDTVALYEDRVGMLNGRPISASTMREDAAKGDIVNFTTNLPNEVQKYAADILNIITNEG
jgi:hypothetical protein